MLGRTQLFIVTALMCTALGLVAHAAAAPPVPQTPQSRLLDVWLDLRLLAIFYPETTSRTFVPNLRKVAAQLNQRLPPIRFGDRPRDVFRFKPGVVVIDRHPPAETWILYSRSPSEAWQLVDDAAGRLRITRITSR